MGNRAVDEDGQQHAAQDGEERQRVDQPGRPEQQAEADQAARLEQQERDAEHEEVGAEAAEAGARDRGRAGRRRAARRAAGCASATGSSRRRRACAGRGTASRPWPAWASARPRPGSRRRVSPGGVPLGRAATRGPSASAAMTLLVDAQQRLASRTRPEHVGELGHQPVLPVVVVEHEDAVSGEVVATAAKACSVNRKDSRRRLAVCADQRQRVGQREDDQVVLLVGAAQEGAAVVDVARDARVLVGLVGVLVDADLLDARVDLDGVDVLARRGPARAPRRCRCRRRRSARSSYVLPGNQL